METSLLGLIRNYTNHLAKILSDTLDTDILIIDTNMHIVGSAFKYLNLYTDIHFGTLISTIILENRNLIVEDKNRMQGCRKCSQFRECKMSSFVGVPIRYENQVVGALALILTRHRARFMFESLDSTVSFLENFADLLANKIENETRTIGLENRLKEVENIMDKMLEAVVYTDYYGNIVHVNQRFCDVLHYDRRLDNGNIRELFPYQIIQDYFLNYKDLSNERLTFEQDGQFFHGVVSSAKIYLSAAEFGTLFYFRPQSDFVKRINISEQGSLVTFEWMQQYFPQEELKRIEEKAGESKNLLIEGLDVELGLLLAKAVFNSSDRNLHDLYVIYADNLYRELLRIYMLDEYGILRNADNSTVVIVQPERLPLYIQRKLAEFMKTGKVKFAKHTVRSNVRFLFCTDAVLEPLVESQLFSMELYLQLGGNRISFEHFSQDSARFHKYVLAGFDFYKKIYRNKNVEFSGEAVKYLRQRYEELGMHFVETLLEKTAAECTGKVTCRELEPIVSRCREGKDFCDLEQTAKGQIQEMLRKGYPKSQIADTLGISRATLYRRIREYSEARDKEDSGKAGCGQDGIPI